VLPCISPKYWENTSSENWHNFSIFHEDHYTRIIIFLLILLQRFILINFKIEKDISALKILLAIKLQHKNKSVNARYTFKGNY